MKDLGLISEKKSLKMASVGAVRVDDSKTWKGARENNGKKLEEVFRDLLLQKVLHSFHIGV